MYPVHVLMSVVEGYEECNLMLKRANLLYTLTIFKSLTLSEIFITSSLAGKVQTDRRIAVTHINPYNMHRCAAKKGREPKSFKET